MTITERLMQSQDEIVEKYMSGVTLTDLGKIYQCNSGSIYFLLKKIGKTKPKNRKNDDKIKDYHDHIFKRREEGASASVIAKEIGFNTATVCRYGDKNGFGFSHNNPRKEGNLLKDKLEEIIELYNSGMSTNNIGKKFGHSGPEVSKLLKKNGVYVSKIRYTVDETFFDVIDTEEKAYILGFFYADGNNRGDGIRIQVCDKEIPYKFKEIMKYSGPITEYPGKTENHQPQYLLSITRKSMADALTRLGCPPAKSLILDFPTEEMVPKHLIRHFVRGWFDGDGNIYNYKKENKWKIQALGTKEFLSGITGIINIEGTWSERFPERNKNNHTWTINTRDDVEKFLDWIYKDSTIFLERKYNQYKEFKVFAEEKRQAKIKKEVKEPIEVRNIRPPLPPKGTSMPGKGNVIRHF